MKSRKTTKGDCKEGVVFSVDQLPDGHVPIGHLDHENKALHSFIIRECNANRVDRFRIPGGKGYGRLYLKEDDLARLEDEWNSRREVRVDGGAVIDNRQTEAAVVALCEINNGITLIHATLERLTLAVENMATEPKTAHDQLVATVESNGFHN